MGGPETILLYVLLILAAAKVGGELATRLNQPAVVGELLMGVLMGPTVMKIIPPFEVLDRTEQMFRSAIENGTDTVGVPTQDFPIVQELHVLAVLAQLGVILLLFEVGLESNVRDFKRIGPSAGLVGTFGVVFSLIAGAALSYALATRFDWVLAPSAIEQPALLHVFIGATLTATSVGITARVLGDLGKVRTPESQIILGAAVFDDVLGLIVLAIVGGLALDPSSLSALGVAKVFGFALGFFFLAIALGVVLAPRLIEYVHRSFRTPFIHLGFAVVFMLLLAYLATLIGLAAIVGAFAGGLALSASQHRHIIFDHLKPVGSLLVGFFFVVLGARVDLSQIVPSTLPLLLLAGAALTIVGILAKLAAGWGVVRVPANRYVVGIGMVPRGEVGLIFALFGLEHDLLTNWQYTTIILVVLLTTVITPLWLKRASGRFSEPTPAAPAQARLGEATEP